MYDYMKALQKRFDRQEHSELDAVSYTHLSDRIHVLYAQFHNAIAHPETGCRLWLYGSSFFGDWGRNSCSVSYTHLWLSCSLVANTLSPVRAISSTGANG